MRKVITNGVVLAQSLVDGKTERLELVVEDDGSVRALTKEQFDFAVAVARESKEDRSGKEVSPPS
jgi:hypothetical protein